MKAKRQFLIPVTLAVAAVLAPAASYAQLVTMTVTGTTSSGYDRIGLFGAPDHDIPAGLPYTLSVSADASYLIDARGDTWRRLFSNYGATGMLTGYVTLDGHTYSWQIDLGRWAEIDLDNYLNRLRVEQEGTNSVDGRQVYANNQLGIDQPRGGWVKSLELDRDMTFAGYGSDGTTRSEFRLTISGYPAPPDAPRDWTMSTWFVAEHQDTMVWTVGPVPEPEEYAMLLLGGAVLAGLGRRARKR